MQVISHKVYEAYEMVGNSFIVEFWGLTTPVPPGIDPDDWPHGSYVDEYLLTDCDVLQAWRWAQARLAPDETYSLFLPVYVKEADATDVGAAITGEDRQGADIGRIRLLGQDQAGPGRFFNRPWDDPLDPSRLPPRPRHDHPPT